MLDKATVITMVSKYADAVVKQFSPTAIVLFGSYAKDGANDDSDIDVAVVFDGYSGDWLEASSALWRLRRDISYDIEPHMLDATDDKSGFVQHVFKTGQIVYQS